MDSVPKSVEEILFKHKNEISDKLGDIEKLYGFTLSIDERAEFLNFIMMREINAHLEISVYKMRKSEAENRTWGSVGLEVNEVLSNILNDYTKFVTFMDKG